MRVRVVRRRVDVLGAADLAQLSQVEHADAVRERADDREVVRDEEVGDPLLGLQLAQQLTDVGLHRHVEG